MNNFMVYDQSKHEENSNALLQVWEFKNNSENIQKNEISAKEKKMHMSRICSRKIKPIQNPALKLKTPIAYQRDSDPNILPIEKEGRGKNILLLCNINLHYKFSFNYL